MAKRHGAHVGSVPKRPGIAIAGCVVLGAALLAAIIWFSWSAATASQYNSELTAATSLVEVVLGKASSAVEGAEQAAKEAESLAKANVASKARQDVEQLVSAYGEDVAVVVVPLDGTEGFAINGDKKFVSASMIKLLVLSEYMTEVDAGVLDPSAAYECSRADIVGGTGRIQEEPRGTLYSYDDLARYMIKYSDNTATNVLIKTMGFDAINGRAADLGLANTDLQRKMMDLNSGVENHISANDAAAFLVGIANGTLASESQCANAREFLLEQTDSLGLRQGLPDAVAFAHKTGLLDTLRHDGGIVFAENPYVIVVLTDIGASSANELMAQVSAVVYEDLNPSE